MNAIGKCCTHYCTCLLIFSIMFFIIMMCFEARKSEYVLSTFQDGVGSLSRIKSLGFAIIFNLALIVGCVLLIKVTDKEEIPEDPVEWKFVYKLERPQPVEDLEGN